MARILIIDDNQDLRELYGQMLREAGHEVMLAASGEEGLRLFRATPADLVITDIFMPGLDGLETMMRFRFDCPAVRVMAISVSPTAGNLLRIAKHLGAVAIVDKPVKRDELLSAVEKALRAS